MRFELTYLALAPDLKLSHPWKDPTFELRDRESAIDYAEKHNVPIPVSKTKIYSQDRNLWHISHEGAEIEHPDQEPNWQNCLTMTTAPDAAPDESEIVEVGFENGNPISVNGKRYRPHELIATLNTIGGKHGVGIALLVENRLIGMKSRGVYETPGGRFCTRLTKRWNRSASSATRCITNSSFRCGMPNLVYYGQWFHPLRECDAGVRRSDQCNPINGSAKVRLYKGPRDGDRCDRLRRACMTASWRVLAWKVTTSPPLEDSSICSDCR